MKWNAARVAVVALLLPALAACSGGGGLSGTVSTPGEGADPMPIGPDAPSPVASPAPMPDTRPPPSASPSNPTTTPPVIVALEAEDGLLNDFPSLLFVDTLADSGLQVGYTVEGQQERSDTAFIEEQWYYMQRCLEQTGVPPLIVLVAGSVDPLTLDDDVLRFIDGSEVATASVSLSGSVLQLSESDFDGSVGVPGFYLRQIIGRTLWTVAGLPERDYPTTCARVIDPAL